MTPTPWTPETILDRPGVWSGVPDGVYHALKLCSSSNLRNLVEKSPYAAQMLMESGGEQAVTSAMRLGTAMHIALLEPDDITRVQSVGKSFQTKAAKALAEELSEGGGVAVNDSELRKVDALRRGYGIPKEVAGALSLLEFTELTILREIDGVLVKHRIDGVGDDFVLDVKTGQVDYRSIQKKLYTMGYDIQFAMYQDAVRWWLDDDSRAKFQALTVRQEFPIEASIYLVDQDVIGGGRDRYRAALRTWAECERTGVWPFAQESVNTKLLVYPKWVEYARAEEVGG